MKSPIPQEALLQHIILLGKTRSGKSSTMRSAIVEPLLDRKKPVAIIDPKGDWWGLKSSADGKSAGYPIVIFGGKHADVPIDEHSGASVAELVGTGNRPCIIDLGGWMVGPRTRFFVAFVSKLFNCVRGPHWLCIDEVHNFAPQGKVFDPDSAKMLHWANRLISEGSGLGLTVISASQRPQKVHKDFVTSNETLIAKRAIHPLDRAAVADWIRGCPDAAKGAEVLNTLAELERSQGWVWSPEIKFGPALVDFPMFKTYDSFAAPTGDSVAKLKGWADVDLDEVKAKLADVVEKEKANDPRVLRAENARLQKELTAALSKTPKNIPRSSQPDPKAASKIAALRKALEAAMKFIVQINAESFFKAGGESVDKASIEKVIAAAGDHIARLIEKQLDERFKGLESLRKQGDKIIAQLKGLLDQDVSVNVDVRHNEPFTISIAPPKPARTPRQSATNGHDGGERKLGAERRPLAVLARVHPAGMTEGQWRVASGLKKSGTWSTYVSRLRTAGFIEKRDKETFITEDGLLACGDEIEPMPEPGPLLVAFWVSKIQAIGPMLNTLAGVYPNWMTQDDLRISLNMKPGSGTFSTYLSRLRGPGLIEEGTGKTLRAARTLMEG